MSSETETRRRAQRVRSYPVDLAIVSVAAVVGYYLVTAAPSESFVRFVAGMFLLFVLPGFAMVSILFPASKRPARPERGDSTRAAGIDSVERLGLSLGLSLVIVPVVVMALAVTEYGLTTGSTTAALAGVTVVAAQLGAIRRLRLPSDERFSVAPSVVLRRLGVGESGASATVSSVILLVAIAFAGGALLFSMASPISGAEYTELGIYTEEDGELVAGEFPAEIGAGDEIPASIVVENNEGETTNYTVVVQQQRLEDGAVVDRTELDRTSYEVADGERTVDNRSITPVPDGNETVRIAIMLYETDETDVPAQPTRATADEDVYFWTTVLDAPDIDD